VDKKNQDMVIVVPELGSAAQSLFGVLDGHGQAGEHRLACMFELRMHVQVWRVCFLCGMHV
jgi:serine/threonine protein phosphatase PrpC